MHTMYYSTGPILNVVISKVEENGETVTMDSHAPARLVEAAQSTGRIDPMYLPPG